MVCNYSRAVWKYIRHLDISDNYDSSGSSNSAQKQTYMQDFATVCISRQYFGFGGPQVYAVSALDLTYILVL